MDMEYVETSNLAVTGPSDGYYEGTYEDPVSGNTVTVRCDSYELEG